MSNYGSDFSVDNVGCPTTEMHDTAKLSSYAVSEVSYESATQQLNNSCTSHSSFSGNRRRSTLRQKCASAILNVCGASRRTVSNVSSQSGTKESTSEDVALPNYSLKNASDLFWNSAIRTMVKPTSLDWNNDQFRLAKFAVQSIRSVQDLGAQQGQGEYVTRDLLGRHVRDLPRSTLAERSRDGTRARISFTEHRRTERKTQNSANDLKQRSKSSAASLSSNGLDDVHRDTTSSARASKNESRSAPHSRFKFWLDQCNRGNSRSNTNPLQEKKSKLCKFSKLQWKGYRRENDYESDSLDSDNQTPYDSIRTTLNSDKTVDVNVEPEKIGMADDNKSTAEVRSGQIDIMEIDKRSKQELSSCEEAPRAHSRSIGSRKVSLVRAPTGESIGIISCESGPLPSWLEEAVWEVETTGSEILSC